VIGISTEVQLLVLAALFYVYDSALLLYVNEAVLVPHRRRWAVKTGNKGFTIRGKDLVFPDLLLPHRPVFRLSWDYKNPIAVTSSKVAWDTEKSTYRVFIPFVYGMTLALFFILPAVLFFYRSDIALLLCLLLIYMNAVGAGVALYASKKSLQLPTKKCWSIFLECVLCPPLTINIIRKISTQKQFSSSLVAAATALLNTETWEVLREELVAQIDDELETVEDMSKEVLKKAKTTLIGTGSNVNN
jgi:hypothetical protein